MNIADVIRFIEYLDENSRYIDLSLIVSLIHITIIIKSPPISISSSLPVQKFPCFLSPYYASCCDNYKSLPKNTPRNGQIRLLSVTPRRIKANIRNSVVSNSPDFGYILPSSTNNSLKEVMK